MILNSSRSHRIFTVKIQSFQPINKDFVKILTSKFHMVDLAGSERKSMLKGN
jgi:hypothetical protein